MKRTRCGDDQIIDILTAHGRVAAAGDARLLILAGAQLDEPVAAYGPVVMNTEAEIRAAIGDFLAGRFGQL